MRKKFISSYLLVLIILLTIAAGFTQSTRPVYTPASSQVLLPILMYHGITTTSSHVNDYFIMQSTFENDLRFLKKEGYETVTPSDLVSFVNGKGKLPKKPVMITFDDGYCNNYNYAYPLLKKYKMKVLISLIGSACQEASEASYRVETYCNMTWKQVEEISDSGYVEVGNHTWNLHKLNKNQKGASKNSNEDSNSYKARLKEDLSKLQSKVKSVTSKAPIAFPWPFGAVSKEGVDVLKSLGIKVTMTSFDGINKVKKGDPNCLFNLKRQLRTPKASLSKLLEL